MEDVDVVVSMETKCSFRTKNVKDENNGGDARVREFCNVPNQAYLLRQSKDSGRYILSHPELV